ncbi:HAEPLYID family protein [Cytophagaceae bacterium ABcell3]|nr:HAEPLYID family protein [Cytophagaceae bacterium ABcell3]
MKFLFFIFLLLPVIAFSQSPFLDTEERNVVDSLIIADEEEGEPAKVFHAEPVFIDLISELGARKGERALELGSEIQDHQSYYRYSTFLEYEFVPIDRLGFEVEIPLTLYSESNNLQDDDREGSRVNALETSMQYTFLVSEKHQTSMAVGYINRLKLPEFRDYGSASLIRGNWYNPFFVAAKRFGRNYHTLIYAGPIIEHNFGEQDLGVVWQINSNFHYMIPGTGNFLGIEINKELENNDFAIIARPQVLINLSRDFSLGFLVGLPIKHETQRMSAFVRLIRDID